MTRTNERLSNSEGLFFYGFAFRFCLDGGTSAPGGLSPPNESLDGTFNGQQSILQSQFPLLSEERIRFEGRPNTVC